MNTITNGVGTERWIEITKGWNIDASVLGSRLHNLTEGLSSPTEQENFTKQDFEKELKKVSRKIKK